MYYICFRRYHARTCMFTDMFSESFTCFGTNGANGQHKCKRDKWERRERKRLTESAEILRRNGRWHARSWLKRLHDTRLGICVCKPHEYVPRNDKDQSCFDSFVGLISFVFISFLFARYILFLYSRSSFFPLPFLSYYFTSLHHRAAVCLFSCLFSRLFICTFAQPRP